MNHPSRLIMPTLGLLLMTAGCARDDRSYPSLAPRAVEKLGFAEPDVPQQQAAPDPALEREIATKRAALDDVARGFDAAARTADAAARAAGRQTVGSDAWLDAQGKLAELDDWRAQISSLVTDIDTMITDRAATLAPVYPALTDLKEAAVAEATRQSDRIDAIEAMIAPA